MTLLELVKDAGVVGAGGAGFPTHAKLSTKAEYILMNGAECEPLLRVDQQLMQLFPDEIIKGFEAAGRYVDAQKALIGVKKKHHEVVRILRQRIEALGYEGFVEVRELEDVYPAGDEQVLVYELTGRVVPEAGIPLHVGCVVINSETALNIYKAMQAESAAAAGAVTEKYITVAGDVPIRLTVKVPVGTPVMDVLKLSGIENFEEYAVIDGGPMMGPVMSNLDGYVTKKSKGFVILKKTHFLIRRKSMTSDQAKRINRATCEQCRMCTDLCPRYLLGHDMQPHKMMRAVNYELSDPDQLTSAYLCCQCNLCELFSCPIGLYPRAANMYVRGSLVQKNIRFQPTGAGSEARNSRGYRQLPSKRLVARLGLYEFDKPAPLTQLDMTPEVVHIGRSQHVGAAAVPVVKTGEKVSAGQLIGAIPEGSLGASIHASISGTIEEINDSYIVIRRS